MHVVFDPDAIDWYSHIAAAQHGGAAYFEGFPYQRGAGVGSIFGSLFRFLLPILKSAGKEVGREGLAIGARVLGDIAQGKNLRHSVINETAEGIRSLADRTNPTEALKKVVTESQSKLLQGGGGAKKGTKRKKSVSPTKKRQGARSVKRKRLDYFGYI